MVIERERERTQINARRKHFNSTSFTNLQSGFASTAKFQINANRKEISTFKKFINSKSIEKQHKIPSRGKGFRTKEQLILHIYISNKYRKNPKKRNQHDRIFIRGKKKRP